MAPMAPPNNNSWNLAVPSRVWRSRRFDPHHGRAVFADLRVDERPNTPVGPPSLGRGWLWRPSSFPPATIIDNLDLRSTGERLHRVFVQAPLARADDEEIARIVR